MAAHGKGKYCEERCHAVQVKCKWLNRSDEVAVAKRKNRNGEESDAYAEQPGENRGEEECSLDDVLFKEADVSFSSTISSIDHL